MHTRVHFLVNCYYRESKVNMTEKYLKLLLVKKKNKAKFEKNNYKNETTIKKFHSDVS